MNKKKKKKEMIRNRMVIYTDIKLGYRGKMRLVLRGRKCEPAAEHM